MENKLKFKIDSIKLDVYKSNIITFIQFAKEYNTQISILTISEIIDKITVVSNNYKSTVLLDLPIKFDYNNLTELVRVFKKAGYEIIIKSEFNQKLLEYVFNAKLRAEFLVNIEKIQYESILYVNDKIMLSFQVGSQKEFDPVISFIKLIRPHTKAQFSLYPKNSMDYDSLKTLLLNITNVCQLGINLNQS